MYAKKQQTGKSFFRNDSNFQPTLGPRNSFQKLRENHDKPIIPLPAIRPETEIIRREFVLPVYHDICELDSNGELDWGYTWNHVHFGKVVNYCPVYVQRDEAYPPYTVEQADTIIAHFDNHFPYGGRRTDFNFPGTNPILPSILTNSTGFVVPNDYSSAYHFEPAAHYNWAVNKYTVL